MNHISNNNRPQSNGSDNSKSPAETSEDNAKLPTQMSSTALPQTFGNGPGTAAQSALQVTRAYLKKYII